MQWITKKLGEVCDLIMGQSPPSSTYNSVGDGLPFFQGKADFGEREPVTRMWCSAPQKITEAGDVLISVRAPVGPSNIAGEKCCIGRGLSALRAHQKVLLPLFLFHYIRSVENRIAQSGSGSTFHAINKNQLFNVEIYLPPLAEQKRIVGILEDADRLRKLRKQANDRMRDFLPALFLKMFGDPQTNPKGWTTRKFLEVCDFEGGTQPPKSQFVYVAQEGYIPFIQIRDFESDANPTFIPDGKKWKKCTKSDVMIARYGASLGHILRGKSGAYNVALVKTIPDRSLINHDFLFFFLQTGYFQEFLRKVSSRAAQAGFNKSNFANFDMPLPHLDLQQKFSSIVADAEAQMENQSRATGGIEDLFKSFLSNAFSVRA